MLLHLATIKVELIRLFYMTSHYKIEAFWDHEAQVWVAESSDILGLVTEADSLDRLTNKLKQMIPELLAANQRINTFT